MSVIKQGYTEYEYEYDNFPVDSGYDYFLMCVSAVIIIWYICSID